MPEASFLDTGVVLGFCFRDDSHHYRCQQYLESNDFSLYFSDHVKSEYLNREPDLAEEITDGILEHVHRLQNSDYEGQLDSMDTSQIRQNLISRHNEARTSLQDFYQNEVPNFIQLEEVVSRLRSLARDVEQNAVENKSWLMERVECWEREGEQEDINEALSEIPWDDRRICLDAHDAAATLDLTMELATVNPQDLVDEGYRELVVENTSLSDVVSLAVRS